MIAIRFSAPPLPSLRLGLPAALIVLSACQSEAPSQTEHDRGRFGDPYEIELAFHSAEPDTPPVLVGDTLVALVTYTGGCEDHDFALEADERPDTTRLWLVHDARGDACEEHIEDELRLPVSNDVSASRVVVLLHPTDPVPFVVERAAAR